MEYNDFNLPPIEQLNRINEEYKKRQKAFVQTVELKNREAQILEDELKIIANNCWKNFEQQDVFLKSLQKKTNSQSLKKHISNLINENQFHFDKFKILYEEILPATIEEHEDVLINKNYSLLIKEGIFNEIELTKMLLELKNYETKIKLQSVISNLINSRLDFIKSISSLIEEFSKPVPSINNFGFFNKKI